MNLLIAWVINAAVLLGLPYVLPAVQMKGFTTALIAAAILGLLNTIIRPILLVLTLPVNVVTLGLFTFIINGLMFWLAAKVLDGFTVAGFWWAVVAALMYSLITWAINSLLLKTKKA